MKMPLQSVGDTCASRAGRHAGCISSKWSKKYSDGQGLRAQCEGRYYAIFLGANRANSRSWPLSKVEYPKRPTDCSTRITKPRAKDVQTSP